ncbi:hypothetical protein DFJ74DRAFT_702458 [Hyaloraphidium curvatum]|nr:hypothetical protein DFJ74DRAFT_702458 [Hyaloraphidium curvatum]
MAAADPTLPAELVRMIMEVLAARGWRRALLHRLMADRATYAIGHEPLLRRIDINLRNLECVVRRFRFDRQRFLLLGSVLDDPKLVSEVSVRLAGMGEAEIRKLRFLLMEMKHLGSLEVDLAGSQVSFAMDLIGAAAGRIRHAVVTSAALRQIQYLLTELNVLAKSGSLVIHPAYPAFLGSPDLVQDLWIPPYGRRPRPRGWRAEIRGLVDCSADGGWTLEQQHEYWASYGYGADVVP